MCGRIGGWLMFVPRFQLGAFEVGFRFFFLAGGPTLLLNNEPYVDTATCFRLAYMMHIYLIYQLTISTSKLGKTANQEVNNYGSVLSLPPWSVFN